MYITRKKQRYYCGNFASSVLNTMVLLGILFLIKVVCGTFIFKTFSVGSFVVLLGVFVFVFSSGSVLFFQSQFGQIN